MSYPDLEFYKKKYPRESEKKAQNTIEINDFRFPAKQVEEIIEAARNPEDMPIGLFGDYGGGKSFFMKIAFKSILEKIYGVKYDQIISYPGKLKNIEDIYEKPGLKDGNLTWEKTYLTKFVQKAIQDKKGILIIIDEFNRMSYDRQNYYLDLCEDNTINLPESGSNIILPRGSKIALVGNTEGFGVHPNHEALYDRLQKIYWNVSFMDSIAEQAFVKWSNLDASACKECEIFGIQINHRTLTKKAAFCIVKATYPVNELKKGAMNFRRYKEYFNLYETCLCIQTFIDRICDRIDRDILAGEDVAGKRLLAQIRSDLEYKIVS